MTQRTRAEFSSVLTANIAENTTGDVSATDVQSTIDDLADSVYFISDTDGPVTSVEGITGDVEIPGETLVTKLEALTGDARLSYNSLSDTPSATGVAISGTPTVGQFARWSDADEIEGVTLTAAMISDAGTMATESSSDYVAASSLSGDGPLVATMNSGGSTGDGFLLDANGNLDPTTANDFVTLNAPRTDVVWSTNTLTINLGDTADYRRNYDPGAATGNYTIANPTGQVAGQAFTVFVLQDATGSRTPSYGTHFKLMFDPANLHEDADTLTVYAAYVKTANTAGGILLFAQSEYVA